MTKLVVTNDWLVEDRPSMLLEMDAEAFAVPIRKKPAPAKQFTPPTLTIPALPASGFINWWEKRKTWAPLKWHQKIGRVNPDVQDSKGRRLVEFLDGTKMWA